MIKPKTAGRIQPIPREKKGRKSLAKLIITDMKVIVWRLAGRALSPSIIAAKSVKAVVIW